MYPLQSNWYSFLNVHHQLLHPHRTYPPYVAQRHVSRVSDENVPVAGAIFQADQIACHEEVLATILEGIMGRIGVYQLGKKYLVTLLRESS